MNQDAHPEIEYLKSLIVPLIDYPDMIKISRTVDERGIFISLSVDPADMGKIIGRGGSTARAIRTLLQAVGYRNRGAVNLKIVEPYA